MHYDLSPKYVDGVHVTEDANDVVVVKVAAQGNPWATVSCTMLMSNDCMEAEARLVARLANTVLATLYLYLH